MTRADRLYRNNLEVNAVVNAAEYARRILVHWADPGYVLDHPGSDETSRGRYTTHSMKPSCPSYLARQ
jgi:hypothetical protein